MRQYAHSPGRFNGIIGRLNIIVPGPFFYEDTGEDDREGERALSEKDH